MSSARMSHNVWDSGWQFYRLGSILGPVFGPFLGPIFGPLFGSPIKREFCSIVRAFFWSNFGSSYLYPFQMSSRASFRADVEAVFQAKKILLNCHPGLFMRNHSGEIPFYLKCDKVWSS